METPTSLKSLIDSIPSLDPEATIFAVEPWTHDTLATLIIEPPDVQLVETESRIGMKYFLEVTIAKELVQGWEKTLNGPPTSEERCDRVICYAVHDA
jgi:hypothetical protein